jgi:iron(III) transport system substrate-binding protein
MGSMNRNPLRGHSPGRRAFHRATLAALAIPFAARAQSRVADSPHRDIYLYKGADRAARIAAEARREGEVAIYTSLNLKDSVPLSEAFEKRTGIKAVLWRASSEKVLQRGVTEARAGHFACDIFETNGPEMEALYREKLLDEFYSPHFTDLPAAAFPRHRHWVADRFNFFTLAYNTDLVKPEEVPKSYEDLLLPRWAGKVGIEGSDTDWFASMVKFMGEPKGLEFFRKLAATRPQIRTGHTLIVELLASGEFPIAGAVYNHAVERLAAKGAPVRWKAIEPTFGRPNAIGVARRAQHPYAALAFADFMLSHEGQEIVKQRKRVPASLSVQTSLNKFPFHMIDPVVVLDENDKWERLWSEIMLQGGKIRKEAE